MAEKRSRKTEEEAKEQKANDVLRRKAGKVKMMPPTIQTFLCTDDSELDRT
jgi:hypothetical protein